jgi:hypothetical protein
MRDTCVSDCWSSVSTQALVLFVVLGILAFVVTLVFLIRRFPRTRQFAPGFVVVGLILIAAAVVSRLLNIGGLNPVNSLLTRPTSFGIGLALIVHGIAQFFSRRD